MEEHNRTTKELHRLSREDMENAKVVEVFSKLRSFDMERVRYMSARDAEKHVNRFYADDGS